MHLEYYKVIRNGNGKRPADDADVTVKYTAQMIDGTIFDSTEKRIPNSMDINLNNVIKGLKIAVPLMDEGGIYEFYVPSELAYGTDYIEVVKANSTTIWRIELVRIR